MNILIKVLIIIIAVILAIAVFAFLFIRLYPTFGGRADRADKQEYAERAENYIDGKFTYPDEYDIEGLPSDVRVSDKYTSPKEKLPVETPSYDENPKIDEFNVTWLGHSNLLIQMHGMNILVDPMFGDRSSPVSFVGPKRFSDLPITIDELPHIDFVVISHDHYDHLHMDSIKQLDKITDRFIVPLGIENHLERWDISKDKITTTAWWDELDINGLTVACTPSRHFSNRGIADQGATLYCSWVFKDEYHQIYESGDTGYGGHFKAIHDKYGDFDFVMTDGAQYSQNWHYVHMYPEEAALACETLGAKAAMPVHWGAFVLSSHAWDDPAERFTKAAEQKGIEVVTPKLGETIRLETYKQYQQRWWRDIN